MLTSYKQKEFLFKRLPLTAGCKSRHESRHCVAISDIHPDTSGLSRQKSRHFGGIVLRQASLMGHPANVAGYVGHIEKAEMGLTMGISGKAVVKESLITAKDLQALEEIEKRAICKGDGK